MRVWGGNVCFTPRRQGLKLSFDQLLLFIHYACTVLLSARAFAWTRGPLLFHLGTQQLDTNIMRSIWTWFAKRFANMRRYVGQPTTSTQKTSE